MTSVTEVRWPRWSAETDPADLARYVLPDVVGSKTQIPDQSPEVPLRRLEEAWSRLRAVGIGYAVERDGSDPSGQWIRPPAEILVAPKNGTCLDLAVLAAGACLHTGLPCAIIVLDAVQPGQPGHALLAVLLGRAWPGEQNPENGVWTRPPDGFLDAVQTDLDGPPRDVLVLDRMT